MKNKNKIKILINQLNNPKKIKKKFVRIINIQISWILKFYFYFFL